MRTGWLIAGVAAALVAAPAFAQTPPSDDPIGDLLARQAEEPEPPAPPERRSKKGGVTKEMSEAAYEARIRASLAAAQSFRGPLEGGWTIAGTDGDLYALQLSDRKGVVEGAWRDLHKVGAADGSGFIDAVERAGSDLTLRFAEGKLTALLHSQPDGRWTGELSNGVTARPIYLKRRVP